jgi:hypothetical protein
VNKVVEGFRKEQGQTEVFLAQIEAGDELPRKKPEVERDNRIKNHLKLWRKS